MSGLLWAPGVAAYLLSSLGIEETLKASWVGVLVQFVVAIPFRTHLWHYIHQSFELDRQFTWFNVSLPMVTCLHLDCELEVRACEHILLRSFFNRLAGTTHLLSNFLHPQPPSSSHLIQYIFSPYYNPLLRHCFLPLPPLQLLHLVLPYSAFPSSSGGVIDSIEICRCVGLRVRLESMAEL